MEEGTANRKKQVRILWLLGGVNVGVWLVMSFALVFVMEYAPGAGDLLPMLAAGTIVALILFFALRKFRKDDAEAENAVTE